MKKPRLMCGVRECECVESDLYRRKVARIV